MPEQLNTLTEDALREADVPYIVNPNDLQKLGIDPEPYFTFVPEAGAAGYLLDRDKDREIIDRLRAMRDQHPKVQ